MEGMALRAGLEKKPVKKQKYIHDGVVQKNMSCRVVGQRPLQKVNKGKNRRAQSRI